MGLEQIHRDHALDPPESGSLFDSPKPSKNIQDLPENPGPNPARWGKSEASCRTLKAVGPLENPPDPSSAPRSHLPPSPPLSASSSRAGLASLFGSSPGSTCSLPVGIDRRTSFIDCKEAANSSSIRASILDSFHADDVVENVTLEHFKGTATHGPRGGAVSETRHEHLECRASLASRLSTKELSAVCKRPSEKQGCVGWTAFAEPTGSAVELGAENSEVSFSSAAEEVPVWGAGSSEETSLSQRGDSSGELDALGSLLRRRRQWLVQAAEFVFQSGQGLGPDVFTVEEEGKRRPLILAALAEAVAFETDLLRLNSEGHTEEKGGGARRQQHCKGVSSSAAHPTRQSGSNHNNPTPNSNDCNDTDFAENTSGSLVEEASAAAAASSPLNSVLGRSAQLKAAREEAFDLVRLLIARGASLHKPSQRGVWPLQFALESASLRVKPSTLFWLSVSLSSRDGDRGSEWLAVF